MIRLPAIIGIGLAVGMTAGGAAYGATGLSAKTTRVVVFKDGYCMVVKEVTGRIDSEHRALVNEVPAAAVLGSFWMLSDGAKPTSIMASQKIVPRGGRNETEKQIELVFDDETPEGEVVLRWEYFSPGIRWIPTYRIEIGEDDTAQVLMQAEILNELEDIENIPVDLVVGVPNFRFKDVVSPMSLKANLEDPLQRAAPELMGQRLSNTLFTQRTGESRGNIDQDVPAAPGVPALPPSLTGEGAQDLFVYTIPRLTLHAAERAAVSIISAAVPVRHLYTWDVSLQRAGTERLPSGGAHVSPVRLLRNDIWHQIELTNTTGLPLTTGAAMAVDGQLPIAQELLTYTPAGGRTQMPLTVAVDVRGSYEEEEVSREPDGIHFDGKTYARVTKKGTLSVTNSKEEEITMLITARFGGNCTEASDNGEITLTDFSAEDWGSSRGHAALVGHSTVEWELDVEAGRSTQVTCLYHYYTR